MPEPMGGEGKFVEADETYVGGKAKNRAYTKTLPGQEAVCRWSSAAARCGRTMFRT